MHVNLYRGLPNVFQLEFKSLEIIKSFGAGRVLENYYIGTTYSSHDRDMFGKKRLQKLLNPRRIIP